VGQSISRQVLQGAFTLACLPHEAFVSLQAIARTAVRMLITGRRLLEWRTAREAQRTARTDLIGFYTFMWMQPLTVTLALLGLILLCSRSLAVATPVIALWLASPMIAFWFGRPVRAR